MRPALEGIAEAELLLLIELERLLKFAAFALSDAAGLLLDGRAELLLIGIMLPALLGVVMPTLEALVLPLLPRGMKDPLDPGAECEITGLPAASSMGTGIDEPGLRGRWLRRPMLLSALPAAYAGVVLFLLQQLHPVNNRPKLHAPIRPAKGILPIVISSPV